MIVRQWGTTADSGPKLSAFLGLGSRDTLVVSGRVRIGLRQEALIFRRVGRERGY